MTGYFRKVQHKTESVGKAEGWWGSQVISVLASLRFGYGSLDNLDDFVARLEGVILCKDMAYILHASLYTFCHKAKHSVNAMKWYNEKSEFTLKSEADNSEEKIVDCQIPSPVGQKLTL